VVFYTTIEIQIIFEMLLALIASQLAIIGQLGKKIYLEKIRLFLESRDNMLKGNNLVNKVTRDIFALF